MTKPDLAGFLQKSAGVFGGDGNTVYAELYGTTIYYWKTKPKTPSDAPRGLLNVAGAEVKPHAKNRMAFTLHGPQMKKTYVMTTSSEAEKTQWIEKIKKPNTANAHKLSLAGPNSDDDDTETTVYSANEKRSKVSLSDFEALAVIGRGSFGRVYQVRKKGTTEVFAMKEMNKEVVERENLTEHIFAEKSILQTINHPFIVKLHYAFQTKDRLYLVLDLLSGGELFFHLGEVGTFDEYRAKFYTAEIALALGYLHSLNIIYRDLKPENAVLDSRGNVCLTDFGLAKTNVTDASASTFCGTPEYLAPEFLLGSPHGRAVDWWSLGIMLYEMLCGIPPFYNENQTLMYEMILTAPLKFPDGIGKEAKDLLRRLLDRNPTTRLQNIDEFKRHPFFKDIDFDKLYQCKIKPPFVPDSETLNNFDNEFTAQSPHVLGEEVGEEHATLVGFTYDGDKEKKGAPTPKK